MTPGAICFDATGTLIELNESVGDVYHRFALEHGVDLPAWRIEDAFRRILRRAPPRGVDGNSVVERRQHEVDWWFERIRETFQATDSTARFEDFPAFAKALFDAYRTADLWRLRPGAARMLDLLRNQGRHLAIISNFDHRLPEVLKMLDIIRFFDFVAIPSESGSAKPDRVVFEMASQALRIPLESLVYLGDDEKEALDRIAGFGLRVYDVREIGELEAFPDLISSAATLPPR